MTAIRTQIAENVFARLEALGDATETELMPSSDPVSFPARHIFDGGHRLIEQEAGSTRYALDLTVEGYLEASGGHEALIALNDLYAATVRALITEPPLGGLAETIDEGDLRITVAPLASKQRLAFALDLVVTFSTRRDDPAQLA